MSSHPSFDYDSLQKFLANAFEVQVSGIPPESLVDLMDIQRSISDDDFDLKNVFDTIVHHASKVADADGVAIALLQANELIYRAGSGRACSYVGRHLAAVLACDTSRERREILRVEDADSDVRIEAAICRQFDAKSLLILSVFEDRKVAGVFEIGFSQAHKFDDREIRVYRMLAGLVEDALLRESHRALKTIPPSEPWAPRQNEQSALQLQHTPRASAPQSSGMTIGVGLIGGARSKHKEAPSHVATKLMPTTTPAEDQQPPVWKSLAAAVALSVVVLSWLVSDGPRRLPSVSVDATPARLNTPAPVTLSRQGPVRRIFGPTSRTPRSITAFKRIRVGPNEVDYVTDDVTIRDFTTITRRSSATVNKGHQFDIGADVTVRYFSQNSDAASEPRPIHSQVPAMNGNARSR